MFEKIKQLADERKMSLNEVEDKIGFARNYLYSLKNKKPTADKLEQMASFFQVSTDYLLGRTEERNGHFIPTKPLTVELESILNQQTFMTYGGENVDPEDLETIAQMIQLILNKRR